ncbi:pectinesterase family protein [Flavobacterium sp. WC2509]|uniref:pectinesterase family protein n=1 Tax=Flavobacterium sp. WC2509 TaxID=3461406 RepID=UPI0040449653
MKRKLRLLFLTMLSSISFIQAQTKTDVWDLGGATLDTSLYNNLLTADIINGWYPVTVPATVPGAIGINLPTTLQLPATPLILTAGVLTLTTGGSDRLYTTNPGITCVAHSTLGTTDPNYTGRYYCNGSAAANGTTRFFTLTLQEDDEVAVVASIESGASSSNLTVVNTTTNLQTELIPLVTSGTTVTLAKFQAKQAGNFKMSCLGGKFNCYRILRKHANYKAITGSIDETQAAGISGYSVVFTNAAGKSWTAPVTAGIFNVNLASGYTYKVTLLNANGYIVSSGESLDVTDTTTTYNGISVLKVDLYDVSGSIVGLGADLSKLSSLKYTPDPTKNKIYVPQPIITGSNYTVKLEAGVDYTISGQGINDYRVSSTNPIQIVGAQSGINIEFTKKAVYPITVTATGLNATQEGKLKLTFTNMNESGYSYDFNYGSAVTLRDGTYKITYSGLDDYVVDLDLTSNLIVNGSALAKTLNFTPVTNWSFDDRTITTSTVAYKGMVFGGTVGMISNQIASGHLLAKTGGTVQIPVSVGDKVVISYYYTANFSVDGGAPITTATNSTAIVEKVEYLYPGNAPGYVTLTMLGSAYTTYITDVSIVKTIAYIPTITVGTGKTYVTINDALSAVSNMIRTATDRVTIMVDPGNYEEMLVINQPNVTLKNAATTPSIALSNSGVDINANAVRVTSYYGHGYKYYSMASDQKWHADVLKVNKENGYSSYTNAGAGTTNGSYWNATVVVNANGFIANDIIFENSYNQYVSKKESEDVLELGDGNKGVRSKIMGSTAVQAKSFVERAAAIAIANNIDKVVLTNCRVIGRQDSFYGGTGARVVVYKGVMMGGTDYLFGGMNAVFYKTALAMNTSEDNNDVSYITAAQQASGRGYLMYECNVTSAAPGTETASAYRSKPGYFGRPWAANTSEVVFYNTTIETSNNPNFAGQSLIIPLGWLDTLSGQSAKMYEFGTIENSGANNQSSRASWATKLATPTLSDGTTAITAFNFTKGTDGWDPLPSLIAADPLGTKSYQTESAVTVYGNKNNITVSNVKSNTTVSVYGLNGALVKSFETATDANFSMKAGIWIVVVKATDGQKTVKLMTY